MVQTSVSERRGTERREGGRGKGRREREGEKGRRERERRGELWVERE